MNYKLQGCIACGDSVWAVYHTILFKIRGFKGVACQLFGWMLGVLAVDGPYRLLRMQIEIEQMHSITSNP